MSVADVLTVLSTLRRALKDKSHTDAEHDLAVALSVKHSLSVYDAMIVASGLSCGATTLYSEDLQPGLRVNKQLRIENPFAPAFKLPRLRAKTAY